MAQITFVIALNVVGLTIAAWGVSMFVGTSSSLGPVEVTVLTSGGLALVALGTLFLAWSVFFADNYTKRVREVDEVGTSRVSPVPLRGREQLLQAMEELQEAALKLIERRREIHHLNVHQWHYAHRDETSQEIAAAKRYRQAKSGLELHRLSLPTQFWMTVDTFCDVIDQSISHEIYSPPNDKRVYEVLNRHWQATVRQINDIALGTPALEQAHQSAD
jgi:hypothetical protein